MAEKAATAKTPDQPDSPQVAHFKFQEAELGEKLKRLNAMSDKEFGSPTQGFNRQESIRRTESGLAEVRLQLKKLAK
jgi:hypothetical protein